MFFWTENNCCLRAVMISKMKLHVQFNVIIILLTITLIINTYGVKKTLQT